MDDGIDPFLPEEVDQEPAVEDVAHDATRRGQRPVAIDRIEVDDDDPMITGQELADGVRADVSGSAGHQQAHDFVVSGGVIAA